MDLIPRINYKIWNVLDHIDTISVESIISANVVLSPVTDFNNKDTIISTWDLDPLYRADLDIFASLHCSNADDDVSLRNLRFNNAVLQKKIVSSAMKISWIENLPK